jgi:hypothetical protein
MGRRLDKKYNLEQKHKHADLIDAFVALLIVSVTFPLIGQAIILTFIPLIFGLFYLLARDLPSGQSIGKKIIGIKIVSTHRLSKYSLYKELVNRNFTLTIEMVYDLIFRVYKKKNFSCE